MSYSSEISKNVHCNDKKLLVIAPHYRYFVKDQVETLSPYFREINVIIIYNPFYAFIGKIFDFLDSYKKKSLLNEFNKPANIRIFFSSVYYLPINFIYGRLGETRYDSVIDCIHKNRIDFDIIHAHFIWCPGYIGARLKEKFRVKLVVTGHGYDVYRLPFINDNWTSLIKTTMGCADHVITVSYKNRDILESLKIGTSIIVIPNGYKNNSFYPRNQNMCRARLGVPINRVMFLAVGNLLEVKGHKYLIEALKLLKKTRDDFMCYIVGEGKLKFSLLRQIEKVGLSENVWLMGRVDHEDMPIWMNAADFFILPSLNEGNPTAMFEALACGKPFIGTSVGGVPEVIVSEDYGLLCDPADPKALFDNIVSALEKKWDKDKILKYSEQFTWDTVTKETMSCLGKLLGSG